MRPRSLFASWLAPLLVAAGLLAPGAESSQADPAPRESAVKAAFLFKFGAFVEWPPETFARRDAPLTIGVMGDDAVADDLEQLVAGRTLEGRPVAVKRISEGSRNVEAHVLFVGSHREGRNKDILPTVKGPALVVTEQDNGLRLGGVINFSTSSGRVRFSVSLASVAQTVEGAVR
jgi:hypothetical protein